LTRLFRTLTPGLEQVTFSRAESREVFAVADETPLEIEMPGEGLRGKARV
jgi:hypothetical protein